MRKSASHSGSNGLLFVLPAVIIIGGLGLFVTVENIWYSLLNWSMLSDPTFVLFRNYQRFFSDPIAVRSLINTFVYALLYVFPTLLISLLIAMMLNHKSAAMSFFRTIFYIPVITSYVIVIVVWQWFFDYDIGLFNQILGLVGIAKVAWLLDKNIALPSLVILSIWKNCGYSIMMYLAGLQTVDTDLYEAAKIDGCGPCAMFFNITLPQLRPITLLSVIMVTTWSFQMFVQPYLMTQGGPDYSTSTITYYLYNQAFSNYNIGYGSAISIISVAMFLTVIMLEKRLLTRKEAK